MKLRLYLLFLEFVNLKVALKNQWKFAKKIMTTMYNCMPECIICSLCFNIPHSPVPTFLRTPLDFQGFQSFPVGSPGFKVLTGFLPTTLDFPLAYLQLCIWWFQLGATHMGASRLEMTTMRMATTAQDLGRMEDFPSVDMVFLPQPTEPVKVIICWCLQVTKGVLCIPVLSNALESQERCTRKINLDIAAQHYLYNDLITLITVTWK